MVHRELNTLDMEPVDKSEGLYTSSPYRAYFGPVSTQMKAYNHHLMKRFWFQGSESCHNLFLLGCEFPVVDLTYINVMIQLWP